MALDKTLGLGLGGIGSFLEALGRYIGCGRKGFFDRKREGRRSFGLTV
jgi:hypothetical protein